MFQSYSNISKYFLRDYVTLAMFFSKRRNPWCFTGCLGRLAAECTSCGLDHVFWCKSNFLSEPWVLCSF